MTKHRQPVNENKLEKILKWSAIAGLGIAMLGVPKDDKEIISLGLGASIICGLSYCSSLIFRYYNQKTTPNKSQTSYSTRKG